jgi:serine protease Do
MFSYPSRFCLAVAAFIGVALSPNPGLAQTDKVVPESREQVTFSYAPVVKRTAPAVVNIYARKVVQRRSGPALFEDPFFKKFFGDDFPFGGAPKERIQNSLGSGVLVRADGVVTLPYCASTPTARHCPAWSSPIRTRWRSAISYWPSATRSGLGRQ